MNNIKTRFLEGTYFLASSASLFLFLVGIHLGLSHVLPDLFAMAFAFIYMATFGKYRIRYGLTPALLGYLVDVGFLKTIVFFALPAVVLFALSFGIATYVGSFISGSRKNLTPDFDLLTIINLITKFHPGSAQDAKDLVNQIPQPKSDKNNMYSSISVKDDLLVIESLIEKIEISMSHLPKEDIFAEKLGRDILEDLLQTIETKWKPEHIENYVAKAKMGHSHESFIYNAMVHSAADNLESGRNHIYRGVLSITGNAYKKLFEHAINQSVSLGIYTEEWANENLRNPVYRNLKNVG